LSGRNQRQAIASNVREKSKKKTTFPEGLWGQENKDIRRPNQKEFFGDK